MASGEPKPATDSSPDTSAPDSPTSATITVTAVEVLALTPQEQSDRFSFKPLLYELLSDENTCATCAERIIPGSLNGWLNVYKNNKNSR